MNEFRFRELAAGEAFDPTALCGDVPFTQADFYGEWQKEAGRTVRRFVIERNGEPAAYVQLIKYPLLSGKSYLYAPYGPVVKEPSDELFALLRDELRRVALEENGVFVRLDFTPPFLNALLFSRFFTPSPRSTYRSSYFQPRREWALDLRKPEAELLAGMHDNTRYSIRAAEKREVRAEIVTQGFERYLEPFYALMEATAKRNGFSLHPKSYYESVFKSLEGGPSFLAVARHGENILALDVVIVFGDTAHYTFAGSSNEERTRFPAYLAQWAAIRHAKASGCAWFNFGGIATSDHPNKNWRGLTRYKQRFGGTEVRRSDFFDIVVSPWWYRLYAVRKFAGSLLP